jgi:brefeldin A-inhibited guanine nucleotide-exchange protein
MEKFAERFTEQNPSVFPTADVAFILSFSIIMLNTDLHNPAIKEERRMTKDGFVRNNRGICDGQDLPEEMLTSIFDRIKCNPISLKEDDEARERVGDPKRTTSVMGLPAALSPASFFSSHYDDDNRTKETNFQKERDHIVRTTESLLKRRKHGSEKQSFSTRRSSLKGRQPSRFVLSEDSGLKDEYVSPMFEVTWGPALASFSTAMESANGTAGALIAIASDEELELAAENAAETIEVCLTGFRFAIGIAGLCGNSVARDAYMLGLSRFSQLGTGVLLEPRHIRCVQTMLSLAREDGELLGMSWEHVFKALSEINRFHQLFQMLARNDRAAAMAAERRRRRLEEKERRRLMRRRILGGPL